MNYRDGHMSYYTDGHMSYQIFTYLSNQVLYDVYGIRRGLKQQRLDNGPRDLGHHTHRMWPRPARIPASGPNGATWEPVVGAGGRGGGARDALRCLRCPEMNRDAPRCPETP